MNPKRKILVVDDEEKVRELIADILKPQNYELFFSENGIDGLKKAQEITPDLILLDIMMPGHDGFKVQQLLKQNETTKNIPVVFVTAKLGLEDVMRALSEGAVGYIEKPFDVKRLVRKVESLLNAPQKEV